MKKFIDAYEFMLRFKKGNWNIKNIYVNEVQAIVDNLCCDLEDDGWCYDMDKAPNGLHASFTGLLKFKDSGKVVVVHDIHLEIGLNAKDNSTVYEYYSIPLYGTVKESRIYTDDKDFIAWRPSILPPLLKKLNRE